MSQSEILKAEQEIDAFFESNDLRNKGFTQAVWTILSVVELHFFKITYINPLDDKQKDVFIDGVLNALTYPLRACKVSSQNIQEPLQKNFIDKDISDADSWIQLAEQYLAFCSIFPYFHKGLLDIYIDGNSLVVSPWSEENLVCQAYDFIQNNEYVSVEDMTFNEQLGSKLWNEIQVNTKVSNTGYMLNFTPKLVELLNSNYTELNDSRYSLPMDWEFKYFSISEFKTVFTTIQAMMYGWSSARLIACEKGVLELGYKSAIWTPTRGELVNRLVRYTNVQKSKISKIIDYLTFGNVGIQYPDIAIQPIVKLSDSKLAISPFVFLNVNSERNLCVLLNQIPEERAIYSSLVNDKEEKLRSEIIDFLSGAQYDIRNGRLKDTDIDLTIIDRDSKHCIVLELKWFIEPAEPREVLQRSEEIAKGVQQVKKVTDLWNLKDTVLLDDVLNIDSSYDFLAIVAPVTSIGNHAAQDSEVPVVKTWHIINKNHEASDLAEVFEWLRKRLYLPKLNVDFFVDNNPVTVGKWSSEWSGISFSAR